MRRRRQRSYNAISDINIANLVDVVLVLLIIFMISAPLLQSGIEINLPKTKVAALESEVEGVIITIDSTGGIYINDVWCRLENVGDEVQEAMDRENTRNVYVRGDSALSYGYAIKVVGKLKESGVDAIGLVTGHEEKGILGRRKR
ncbi:MAG: biopolymer transporter ExbD [bacterium]